MIYNCLTQEDKETIYNYHWNIDVIEEDLYYKSLFKKYDWLEEVYNKCVNEAIVELGYGGTCYKFEEEELVKWLMFLMWRLNEKLNVGL